MELGDEKKIQIIKQWLQSGSINFFGLQFSGKDTQAECFAEMLKANLVKSGAILRSSPSAGIKAIIDKGNLAPTNQYLSVVLPYLNQPQFNGQPLMLSSVGRWIGEEQKILEAAKAAKHPIKAAVYLKISEDVAFERFKTANRNREDDYEQALKLRISEFKNKTLPVIEVYKKLGLLIEVDGTPSTNQVTQSILLQLYNKALVN